MRYCGWQKAIKTSNQLIMFFDRVPHLYSRMSRSPCAIPFIHFKFVSSQLNFRTMAMTMRGPLAGDIDEYIAGFPKDVRTKLQEIRGTIRKAAPQAEEAIKYGIPTFTLHGNLVHFAAYKNHIGFYPAPRGIEAFKKELSAYEGSKGTIKFPLDIKLPLPLISKIVKFRVKENVDKAKSKTKKTS
jgi:uncharacterized protein YdhG (YjbR/CyaY superfamily)